MLDTVVFDVDGTLVDSNYHHLLAWTRAFSALDLTVPGWCLHACLGMGGDKLVAAAAGQQVEDEHGDEVRERWRTTYDDLLAEVRPCAGAVQALEAFDDLGIAVVLASSGNEDHLERSLKILGIDPSRYPVASSADVDDTKPEGDLVDLALAKVGGNQGLMIGDTVWDVKAGEKADVPVIGVRTGGIAPERLREAGAIAVYEDTAALRADIAAITRRFAGPADGGG